MECLGLIGAAFVVLLHSRSEIKNLEMDLKEALESGDNTKINSVTNELAEKYSVLMEANPASLSKRINASGEFCTMKDNAEEIDKAFKGLNKVELPKMWKMIYETKDQLDEEKLEQENEEDEDDPEPTEYDSMY